jgi:NAD(P)-dependent dehydrogenase (short-subunit alcohol dehydrogenase family)
MKSFTNKRVVVTGAGSGIGRALALQLDKEGAVLALSDINAENLAETVELLSRPCYSEALDVSNRDAVYKHADNVRAELGDVELVINNAGVALAQTVSQMEYDDFDWVMSINFWGTVYGTKAFLPQLMRHKESAVVNVSSIFGLVGIPTQSAYNASKFAVRGFTESLMTELAGSPVSVYCVHPGGVKTAIAKHARHYVGPTGSTAHGRDSELFEKIAISTPEKAANTILKGVKKNNQRILIGPDARVVDLLQRLLPSGYKQVISVATRTFA